MNRDFKESGSAGFSHTTRRKRRGEDTGGMARAGYQTRWRDARE
jgi:hypothetical protein